jgi:hypothetical protein
MEVLHIAIAFTLLLCTSFSVPVFANDHSTLTKTGAKGIETTSTEQYAIEKNQIETQSLKSFIKALIRILKAASKDEKLDSEDLEELYYYSEPGEQDYIRVIWVNGDYSDADDAAYNIFINSVEEDTIIERSNGAVTGENEDGVIITYRSWSTDGVPTLSFNGIKNLRKLKFYPTET